MKLETRIIITVLVIVALVIIIGGYVFLNSTIAPLEQKEDITIIAATENIDIQAETFNGDITIQSSTGNAVEITHSIQVPKGHLLDISDTAMNQTQNGITKIIVQEKMVNQNIVPAVNYRVSITIKLPITSQYNLTLNTLNGNIVKPQLNDSKIELSTSNGRIDVTDDNALSINASSLNGNVNVKLAQGTLFQVDANTSNGNVTYQGIAMSTSTQTPTHVTGSTTEGQGKLSMTLSSANGNVTVEYFTK